MANKALQAIPFGSTGHYVMLTSKRHNSGWKVPEENFDETGQDESRRLGLGGAYGEHRRDGAILL
jgi:hypothetical protein